MFRSGVFGDPVDGFGRAIALWNPLVIEMIVSWEIFASRAPRARSAHPQRASAARKNVFRSLHKLL